MALVMALGALGVGYAMWSDTVTIDGTVKTGSVDIVVEELSSTYVYKVINPEGYQMPDLSTEIYRSMICWSVNSVASPPGNAPLPLDDELVAGDDLLLVASAVTAEAAGGDDQVLEMTFDNLFPTTNCNIVGDVVLHYIGTIPAHVAYDLTWTGVDKALLQNYVHLQWDLKYGPNNPGGI